MVVGRLKGGHDVKEVDLEKIAKLITEEVERNGQRPTATKFEVCVETIKNWAASESL
jgi:hypothetical protein